MEVCSYFRGADGVVKTFMLRTQRGNKDFRMNAIEVVTMLHERYQVEFDVCQFLNGEQKVAKEGSSLSCAI